ncbi:MAG: ATP-binding cassette domain-containing protein, partial [Pyrinomonadaceae bacterium]|nr:ATP-binding cassette domain-containing protein [Phycisphaerales bacterium]
LIAGIMDPEQGEVIVSGQRVHSLRGAARDSFRGKHIGMIFQTFNLLSGFSAIENVMAALMFSAVPRGEHQARAAGLLNHLGIKAHHKTPEQLSVGMQQRVAVARAVACDPVLVLADEPTASLDPENAAGAIELIQQVCREKNAALLCVSHDPAMKQRFAKSHSLDGLVAV